jgi:hypothetical protein
MGIINLWPDLPQENLEPHLEDAISVYVAPVANGIRIATLLFEEEVLFSIDRFFDRSFNLVDNPRVLGPTRHHN